MLNKSSARSGETCSKNDSISSRFYNYSDVIVIGAGFGGIAVALRMRARGYSVTLIDRLKAIGGRAQVFEKGGFRHDAGPTIITAPFLFEELFELFNEKIEDYTIL